MNNKVSIFANDVNAPVKVELNDKGENIVSARNLYAFLEVNEQFTDWCNRMFGYGFVENQDYTRVFQENMKNTKGGRPKIDYAITLDCAREISMLQRNDKGKQARQYFLECEKRLKSIEKSLVSQEEFLELKDMVIDCFLKTEAYVIDLEERYDKRFEKLEENHHNAKSSLDTTVNRVDKIEERLDFKAVACVYVMYCKRRQWHKLGSSYDAKERKDDFSTVERHLKIVIEIPTSSREEAYALENALKKRFVPRHKEGEWYGLLPEDLAYLHELAQSNRLHLLRTTTV
jgi:phage anti-repressor protein